MAGRPISLVASVPAVGSVGLTLADGLARALLPALSRAVPRRVGVVGALAGGTVAAILSGTPRAQAGGLRTTGAPTVCSRRTTPGGVRSGPSIAGARAGGARLAYGTP